MVIFTSICANYLHKARTLADSVKAHMPEARFIVCLLEREINEIFYHPDFDEIVLAKDAWEGNFNQFIYKHSIVEASTAVKGQFFRYLYNAYPQETEFIYLDPDTYVYGPFHELRETLRTEPIVLCPHLLQPGNIDMELSSTAHGVYNLGFLAVNRSEEARRFIDWWANRLYLFCYDDIQRGIFTDQKWIDLAPCFFDTHIFKHRGYDFGTWSLLDCGMTCENGVYKVKGDPLRFIHFSGYGATIEKCMRDWLPQGEHPFRDLYALYQLEHEKNNQDAVSKYPWSYAAYESGEKIDDNLRIKYRANYDVMFSTENPFALSNAQMRSRLMSDNPSKWKQRIDKAAGIYKNEGMMALMKKIVVKLSAINNLSDRLDLKARKEFLKERLVPIAGILAITCIFFSLPINFSFDSVLYLGYVDYFEGILPVSLWYRVRGWGFPLILFLSKRLFGATAYGISITFYLIFLLFLFAIARISRRMLPGILSEISVWGLIVFNPIILGYFHFILTEGPSAAIAALTTLGFIVLYEKSLVNESKGLILCKNLLLALLCVLAYFLKQTLVAIPILIYLFFEFQLIILGHRKLILRMVCAVMAAFVFLSSLAVWNDITEEGAKRSFYSDSEFLIGGLEAGLVYFKRAEDGSAINFIVDDEIIDSIPTDASITPMEYFLTCLTSHPWMVVKGYIETYLMVSNFYDFDPTKYSSSLNATIVREPSLTRAQENAALAEYPRFYGLNLDLFQEMGGNERLIPYGQYTDDNLVTRALYNIYVRVAYRCLYTLSVLYAPLAFVLHTILFVRKKKTADYKWHGIQMALAGIVFAYGMAMGMTWLISDRYMFPVFPFAILVVVTDLKQVVVCMTRLLAGLMVKRKGA